MLACTLSSEQGKGSNLPSPRSATKVYCLSVYSGLVWVTKLQLTFPRLAGVLKENVETNE